MGYDVKEIRLLSMDDNKVYIISLPENDKEMLLKFKNLIEHMNNFCFDSFRQENDLKCMHCIYEPLCSYSALKGCENNAYWP